MKTILVPTDYSETAKNAAIYAINLAGQLQVKNIILYNAYQAPPMITETAVMPTATMPYFDIETFYDISKKSMEQFKESVQNVCPSDIQIETQIEYGGLDNDVKKLVKINAIDLIVMGISATSKIEEVLIGSTAISVVKNTDIPVFIVPSDARYASVKNLMLACDFKKVAETIPLQPLKSILTATNAALYVVNVYENDNEMTSARAYQQELLYSLLKEFEPHFHFENNEDFITGINDFVKANNIDLIVTIPKKHGFFEGLFKESHTKKLAFHSHVPLMYIHEHDL